MTTRLGRDMTDGGGTVGARRDRGGNPGRCAGDHGAMFMRLRNVPSGRLSYAIGCGSTSPPTPVDYGYMARRQPRVHNCLGVDMEWG